MFGKIQHPLLRVEKCLMLVKHHGCWEIVILSLVGSYCQMAKQSHENDKMKMVFEGNIVNRMKFYLHGPK